MSTARSASRGFSFAGQGQNMGIAFVRLKDWEERPRPDQSVQAIAGRAFPAFMQIRDAMVFPIVPPSVIELGNVSGFDFYLQARAGQPHEQLAGCAQPAAGHGGRQDGRIASARPNGLEDAAQYNLDIDWMQGRRDGGFGHRCRQPAVGRLGRQLCQRLHRPGPDQARLCAGRADLAQRADRYRPLAGAQRFGRAGAVLELCRGPLELWPAGSDAL